MSSIVTWKRETFKRIQNHFGCYPLPNRDSHFNTISYNNNGYYWFYWNKSPLRHVLTLFNRYQSLESFTIEKIALLFLASSHYITAIYEYFKRKYLVKKYYSSWNCIVLCLLKKKITILFIVLNLFVLGLCVCIDLKGDFRTSIFVEKKC